LANHLESENKIYPATSLPNADIRFIESTAQLDSFRAELRAGIAKWVALDQRTYQSLDCGL
jgi:hypothetical protein